MKLEILNLPGDDPNHYTVLKSKGGPKHFLFEVKLHTEADNHTFTDLTDILRAVLIRWKSERRTE